MTISIISSMHNSRQSVVDTVDKLFLPSLARNADSDMELILLDDASPKKKETIAMVDSHMSELKSRFGQVRFIENPENLGFGPSYNGGIAKAEGDKIVVANDDLYFPLGTVRKLVDVLDESEATGIVGPITNERATFTYQYARQAPHIESFDPKEIQRIEDFATYVAEKLPGLRIDTDMISGFCFAMDTRELQELGGFDERFAYGLYEDTDLVRRVKQERDAVIAADVYINHGGIEGSSGSIKQYPWRMLKAGIVNQWKYGQKWHDHLGTTKHFFKGIYRMQTGRDTISELLE